MFKRVFFTLLLGAPAYVTLRFLGPDFLTLGTFHWNVLNICYAAVATMFASIYLKGFDE
jgi:hypothetical protein